MVVVVGSERESWARGNFFIFWCFTMVARWRNWVKMGGGEIRGGEFEGASTIFGFWKISGGNYRFLTKNRADGMVYP